MELTLSFRDYFLKNTRDMVSIEDFTEYLKVFQEIIYTIAEDKGSRVKREHFKFLVKEINPGSIDCVIESYYPYRDLKKKEPVRTVVEYFEKIAEQIDTEDDKATFNNLKKIILDPDNRKLLYNYFKRIIPRRNKAFQIYLGNKRLNTDAKRIYLAKEKYKKKLSAWKELDAQQQKETLFNPVK